LWLRADTITGLSDGDRVSSWTDQSTNGADATQATDLRRPRYKVNILNSRPVVRFTAVAGNYERLNIGDKFSTMTAGELFIVIKAVSANGSNQSHLTGFIGFGTGAQSSHYAWIDGLIYDDWGSNLRKAGFTPTVAITSWRIVNIISTSSEWTYTIGGVQQVTTATNTVGFNTAPTIGCDWCGSYNLDGDIAEIIIYNRKVDTPERAQVNSYLNRKYGL
jgi:hypothetical protein